MRKARCVDVLPVAASPEQGYRLRALHVRGNRVGFFREGTHQICDAAATHQLSSTALAAVEGLAASLGDGLAAVDSILVAENVAATERALHVVPVAGAPEPEPLAEHRVTDTAADVFGAAPPIDASVRWRRGADAFFQANRFLLGGLLRTVLAAAEGERCADLSPLVCGARSGDAPSKRRARCAIHDNAAPVVTPGPNAADYTPAGARLRR